MPADNTVNICIGHLPFPVQYSNYIDLMISPEPVHAPYNTIHIKHKHLGKNGHTLSEYTQLLWIFDNIEAVLGSHQFIRTFHYRRFVATSPPTQGIKSINQPWSTTISELELGALSTEFSRYSSEECFNTPVTFNDGILGQYSKHHVLNDLLMFLKYLGDNQILNDDEIVEFAKSTIQIPAASIGIFRRETFEFIFGTLRKAAEFINSEHYVVRDGYQRRSGGFLLERLNSYLIIKLIQSGNSKPNFGYNIVTSDTTTISGSE
jgi:hypothetical protein